MPNIWQTPISSGPDSKPGRYSGRGTSIPRTRDGLSFENDPGFAESKAEQKWLDRHGYPNEKQLEAYMPAPETLLKQAAETGDMAAQAMLDARLLPTDQKAQQRLVDAGAEGNLFALNMLASYQGAVPVEILWRPMQCRVWRKCGATPELE
ncbi:hypothetical protein ACFOHQ_08135 [Xanthomonas fragariae]